MKIFVQQSFQRDEEALPKARFLFSVFLLAGLVASFMGFVRWQTSIAMGMVDFVFATLCFGLLAFLRKRPQSIEIVSSIALILCFLLFTAIYMLAPDNSMRLSLFFLLAASAFFLKGRKAGRLWLGLLLCVILAVHFSGLFSTGYSFLDIGTTCLYLIALLFIFENYESFKEKERERKRIADEALRSKAIAEVANQAKSQFLATMSHEIRTPMNGILGMAQMLLMNDISESERREYARTILNSGTTLLTLLNDILDFSKIEAGKLEFERAVVEPEQILQEAVGLFRENAAEKGLTLEARWEAGGVSVRPDCSVYLLDPHRLRQMLSNLTNNAIKFTSQGLVSIQGREVSRSGNQALLEFSVSDTGVGIAKDKFDLLFKPFSQVDSSITRQFGGTGLGLSIVRSLAQRMGGEVGVDSEPGRGARFWFRLPADVASVVSDRRKSARTHEEIAVSCGLKGIVLVVEDNPVNQRVIEVLLKKLGLDCRIASDGEAGVQAVVADPSIDLVLMDIHMPVMDGYEATRTIRGSKLDQRVKRLSIIALTADAFDEDRQRCLDAGMDDFLTKPISLDKLTLALQRWLPSPAS